MWKENLPESCPPNKATEVEMDVYRILKHSSHSEKDFVTYAELYPDNERYRTMCAAYGISFYDTFERAKLALSKNLELGEYIGEYTIKKTHGQCVINNKSGHCNIWFYKSWDVKIFSPNTIK